MKVEILPNEPPKPMDEYPLTWEQVKKTPGVYDVRGGHTKLLVQPNATGGGMSVAAIINESPIYFNTTDAWKHDKFRLSREPLILKLTND